MKIKAYNGFLAELKWPLGLPIVSNEIEMFSASYEMRAVISSYVYHYS